MNQNQTESKPSTPEQPSPEGLDETICSLSLAELLAWADEECAKIECESWPIADTGDYDSAWCVYAHHLNEDEARCVGGGPTIERALRAAWIEEHSPENASAMAPPPQRLPSTKDVPGG